MAESIYQEKQNRQTDTPLQRKSGVALQDNREPGALGILTDNRAAQLAQKSNNTGLPDNLKSGIEHLSGMSMDHVRVHYNSSQPVQLNALAYAQGSNIHVAPGQEKHLPHEAWHVVQQARGRVKPTTQMKQGVQINDEAGLEREADVMGGRALQLKPKENEIIQSHSKQCGCASCTSSLQQPLQKKNITSGEKILQLRPCQECGKEKGHYSSCSRHKHNRSSTGRGDHTLGGSHDDGSGFQHSGAGGDRHEKGRRAAQKAKERKKGK